jgi:DNA invertase Pin-like site-specific DNA recombinase
MGTIRRDFMSAEKTAIYCRVDGGGNPEMRRDMLALQKRKLEHYAKMKGLQISGCYEDDGFSGHDLKRPGLIQLMKDHDTGAFTQVLVVNRSRLYRGSRWNEPKWPFRICSINPLEHDLIR